MEPTNDAINHPKHYTSGGIETIDVIASICTSMSLNAYEGYLLGNIIKYLSRFKNKNGVEDLKKARWYLDELIGENRPDNGPVSPYMPGATPLQPCQTGYPVHLVTKDSFTYC